MLKIAPWLAKWLLSPLVLAAGAIIAGAYGALHNQASYTVAPDYFHAFKFVQFEIPPELQNRLGAAIVGWRASWWMGVLVGFPLLLIASITTASARSLVLRTLTAYGVVVATAAVVGLSVLAYAYLTLTPGELPPFRYPAGVDQVAFARAGSMHNASYLGGFLGVLTGSIYLALYRDRPPKTRRNRDLNDVDASPPG